VGGALVRRLSGVLGPKRRIVATDIHFEQRPDLPGVEYVEGAIEDRDHLARLTGDQIDQVFHLATVAGVQSADFRLGKRVNLDATMALLEALSTQGAPAQFIYSSSIGVFGSPLPLLVDDATLPSPGWSYGTHKLVCEYLITDYARAGLVDGVALRFPGILARPEGSATMLSAFLSNVFYAARDDRAFSLPLGPDDAVWAMSLRRCVDNVLHAAALPAGALPARRAWTLPALRVTMRELVEALADAYGSHVFDRISYDPQPAAQELFAMPHLRASGAEKLGFVGDRSASELVQNVIAESSALAATQARVAG
jgi:nucleoside-diphosphate-sugar epimerase